jgi:uncharacterized membrane protein YqaE (UPF0057 family)
MIIVPLIYSFTSHGFSDPLINIILKMLKGKFPK